MYFILQEKVTGALGLTKLCCVTSIWPIISLKYIPLTTAEVQVAEWLIGWAFKRLAF